jgi:hypothetical protein
LATAQRFEEAAEMRDRTQALVLAINRQRRCDQLRAAGSVIVRAGDILYDFESGVLVNTRREDQLFSPIASRNSKVLQGIFDFLHPHHPESLESGPLDRHVFDEVMCIARFLDDDATHPILEACSGYWASPVQAVPELRRLDLHQAA